MKKKLSEKYNKICQKYIDAFAILHEIDFEGWVGDKVGDVACFADYYFDFDIIRYVIDEGISFTYLSDWFYFSDQFPNAAIKISAYCKLRNDFVFKSGFNFDLNQFEKYLLNLRIQKFGKDDN